MNEKYFVYGLAVAGLLTCAGLLAMNANAGIICERLQYGNFVPTYYWTIPDAHGDDYFNERFTMQYNGHLTRAYLTMYQAGSVNITGEGIDVIVWDDDGFGFPGTELGRVNIPYDNIAIFPGETEVNLTPLGLLFTAGQDFHIGYTTVNQAAGNVMAILSDDGSGPLLNRSSEYWGGGWGLMINDWGLDVDFLIAAEVCYDIVYVPDDYPTIQDAINNATDGDTIVVRDGTYYENVVVNKSITLMAGSSPVIDGMGGTGINITANNTVVQDMTIINCSTGVYIHNDSFTIHGVLLDNNTICNATGTDAYGISLLEAQDNTFENTTICNFTQVTGTAYGVYMVESNGSEFINLTIYELDVVVQTDYGIYLDNSHWNNFTGIVIYDLNGDSADYGIYLTDSNNNSFENTSIYNVTASNGDAYGIYLSHSDNNTFSENMSILNLDPIADFDVFGIYLTSSDNNEFMDNITISDMEGDYYGYGIYFSSSDNNTFFGDIAISNVTLHSGEIGYGIYLSSSDNNTFLGGIDILDFEVEAGDGYGVYLTSSDNNTFSGNITIPDFDIYHDAYGVYLNNSDDNNFTGLINLSDWGYPTGMDFGISGIYLNRSDHNLFGPLLIYDLRCSWYVVSGIFLNYSDDNTFDNTTINDLSNGLNVYGVYLNHSDGNAFNSTVVENMSGDYAYGLKMSKSHNNVFNHTNISRIEGFMEASGIGVSSYPSGSDNNVFNGGNISNITAPAWWSFHFCEYSDNNTIINYTLSSYPTTVSFIYGNGIALKSVQKSEFVLKPGYVDIGKFINITNITATSWINITIHYDDEDVPEYTKETTLRFYELNQSQWEPMPSTVNEASNYVNANITSFSIYGIFGNFTTITFNLSEGWNMITIPLINDSFSTAEELGTFIPNCTIVALWSAKEQRYVSHIVGFGYDFDIVNGTGYFIYVTDDTQVTLNGSGIKEINLSLKTGYDLIGWTHSLPTNASTLLSHITNCVKVATWNASQQMWMPEYMAFQQVPGFDPEIIAGEGMFVFIISGTTQWDGD
ncbi:MAG: hypothetical protein FE046_00460 [Thermoplasmata archaeon]|nr:MAG: hypothetical protein FE046_00460 [Thermoplasmata archaeon]